MDDLALLLLVVIAGPVVLLCLLAEAVYMWRLGVLRSHPVRSAIALLVTGVGAVFLSAIVLLPWLAPDLGTFMLAFVLPGLIAYALIAPPLFWWARKQRRFLVGSIAVVYAGAAVALFYEIGPPSNTPVMQARSRSGLDVPSDARVVEFRNHPMGPFESELDLYLELALSNEAAIRLSNQARGRGYRSIASSFPSNEEVSRAAVTGLVVGEAESAARSLLGDDRAGLYEYNKIGPRSHRIVALDSARARLVIQVWLQN